ncbi:alpha/beta hydrolase [Lichenihabitans sp. Uapishka_5]|uniref:alpha/beta fold hydrolase n=1 Tax=Lichenihabitans sp. Uapishka_5 TaxID=3037302 RepID=UPI0029E7DFBE|nr:alpha/beta hydrolase [Lichenihabitans sp. Uapishka_5]MDX7951845.1 alpha/beta hydrolase [Lichenihabitans sp. Uapishka_5]
MAYVNAKDGTQIYYKDWGTGPAIFFSHGWPLSADMWEQQMLFFASNGFRVIAHDRRGFGRSSQPWSGYDYDTFADDIASVLEAAEVREVALVGFSMGGGDVARYVARSKGARVSKACLTSAVTPYFIKAGDNPDGTPPEVFDGIRAGLLNDRPQFLDDFNALFYGTNKHPGVVSAGVLKQTLQIALTGGIKGTYDCVGAFSESDFRPDMAAFTMPTLIVHGDEDQVVPIKAAGEAAHRLIPHSEFKVYQGAPHALTTTHKDRYNADLLAFLRA